MHQRWKIAAFYQFTQLEDRDAWADRSVRHGVAHGLRGTIIWAPEGVNATLCGSEGAIDATLALLRADERFAAMPAKISWSDYPPFPKYKVKRKPEIVTFRQPDADPREAVGTYLDPEAWNALIQQPGVVTIDTRNAYEVEVGCFPGALNPNTEDFTAFAAFVDAQLAAQKDQTIAMYCTGGIRCERATAYLKQQGFANVYHLKGGILHYLEVIDREDSLWQGDCFVFDYRVAVDHDLNPAHWKIDPESGDPVPMQPGDLERLTALKRNEAFELL